MLLVSLSFVAGYEHIYEFVDWIFAEGTGYSGTRLNIRRWQDNTSNRYQLGDRSRKPFFSSPAKCRMYIVTGVARWTLAIPGNASRSCCNMDILGGDGTHIGVSSRQGLHLTSIWEPTRPRDSYIKRGRLHRRPASFRYRQGEHDVVVLDENAVKPGSDLSKSCREAVAVLRGNSSPNPEDLEQTSVILPDVIRCELIRWYAGLTVTSSQWKPLQQLLLFSLSSESITGAICANAIPMVTELISVNRYQSRESVSLQTYLQTNRRMFEKYCATTHIWNLAFAQVSSFDSNGRLLASTEAFIQFLGRNSLSTCICTDVNMLTD
jgi:hypothetical protein